MFTDDPVTPARLETLVGLIRRNPRRQFKREQLIALLQPDGLPDLTPQSKQANEVLKAGHELSLLATDDGVVGVTFDRNDERSTERIILDALDEHVLARQDIEPNFALFYSYLLGQGGGAKYNNREWATRFEQDVFAGERGRNSINEAKVTGIRRWLTYVGLGWDDPTGAFQPNPYRRLSRRLPVIFDDAGQLNGEEFMSRLGSACPELDGGEIFCQANAGYHAEAKTCTLGLAAALVELHEDEILHLHCEPDSRGWSIEAVEPRFDGRMLRSWRLNAVELVRGS